MSSMLMQLRAQTQEVIDAISRIGPELYGTEDTIDQVYPALRAAVDGTNDPSLREVMEMLVGVVDRTAEISGRYGEIQRRLYDYLEAL